MKKIMVLIAVVGILGMLLACIAGCSNVIPTSKVIRRQYVFVVNSRVSQRIDCPAPRLSRTYLPTSGLWVEVDGNLPVQGIYSGIDGNPYIRMYGRTSKPSEGNARIQVFVNVTHNGRWSTPLELCDARIEWKIVS